MIKDDPISKKPCEELNKLSNDTRLKTALNSLKSDTGLNYEKGFAISKDNATQQYNQPVPIQASLNDPDNLPIMNFLGGNNIGCFHIHATDATGVFPMFSDGDINYLFYVAKKHNNGTTPKNYSEYVITLTVPEGTFALKIKDITKFAQARNNPENWSGNVLQKLRDKYINRKSTDDIAGMKKDLLQIFNELDMGIGLYEANSNLTSWSEVILNPNNPDENPINEPCN